MSPDRIRRRREQMRPDMAAMLADAETRPCPRCGAGIGQPCTNIRFGGEAHLPCLDRRKTPGDDQ